MLRRSLISALLLSSAVLCAQNAPAKTQTTNTTKSSKQSSKKHASKKKPTAVVKQEPAPAPQPPPPPPTLAQQPPVAPRVSYQNGLLSIDAPNSTLGDVINGIRRATGATIDGPANASDRVIVHLGPGQPREVLSSLLHGSRFDYIVMGTPQQPNGLSKILLIARQNTPQPISAVANGAAPNNVNRPPVAETQSDSEEEDNTPDRDENPEVQQSPQPMSEQQMGGPPAYNPPLPNQQQPSAQQPNGQAQPNPGITPTTPPDQNANPNQPKTPEQLYKDLQNLEQQRQQQQNQNQQPPPQ